MTKYKIYRVNSTGAVYVDIVEAYDWQSLFSQYQYTGDPIFKAVVIGGIESEEDE